MNFKKSLLGLIFIAVFGTVHGQDIHYSMFQMSPVGLNPSLAGSFSGTARVGGVYRIQDVLTGSTEGIAARRGYETYTAFVDLPVVRGIREQDWIGLGVGLNSDVAGIGNFRETTSIQAVSYHYPLDKKRLNVISFGVNSGTVSYNFKKYTNYEFENENETYFSGYNPKDEKTSPDFGLGISYKGRLDKLSAIRAGVSAFHVTNPINNLSRGSTNSNKKPSTVVGFVEYDRLINSRTRIIPAALVQVAGRSTEIAFQALAAYYFDPQKDITIYGGLGFRMNRLNPADAVPVYLGFDIGDVKARLAYDFTISGKTYTNRGFGALEFSVNYILKLYKRPKIDPAIFCPRF